MKFLSDIIAFASAEKIEVPFEPLSQYPLVVMVGLTGVGKTTVIQQLEKVVDFILLPNRRKVTDVVMIAPLQQSEGLVPYMVTDRLKRFEYTARYRAKQPGGMAHALSQLVIKANAASLNLFFDGLRGLNEVQHAATYFPKVRFIILDAPDMVRLKRLLNRADAFDTATITTLAPDNNIGSALRAIPDLSGVFDDEQLQHLSHTLSDIPAEEVIKKATIIVTERRNYDSQATSEYLTKTLPPRRVLLLDTVAQSLERITKHIKEWLVE